MGFVQFGFLAALAGIAVPIIIHLVFGQRARRVDLGTLRFLRIALSQNARRKRLKRWLLLALRMRLPGLLLAGHVAVTVELAAALDHEIGRGDVPVDLRVQYEFADPQFTMIWEQSAGAKLNLLWEAGIESASGVAVSTPQAQAYKVRPAFSARLRCEKTHAKAPCLPILPMTLDFTAPVPIRHASKIVLQGAGKSWKPDIHKSDIKSGATRSLAFKGPFPEAAALTLDRRDGRQAAAGDLTVAPRLQRLRRGGVVAVDVDDHGLLQFRPVPCRDGAWRRRRPASA